MTDDYGTARILPPYPGLSWTETRTAAVEFAAHGWPLLTGTYQLDERTEWLGKRGAVGLEPVAEQWATAMVTDAAVALEEWTRRPHSVLLACGFGVDALEIPGAGAARYIDALRASGDLGPIAVTPFGTWLLFVGSGERLHPILATRSGTRLHSRRSWVALPPTTQGHMPYRWRMSPTSVGWSVPGCRSVQETILGTTEQTSQPVTRLIGTQTT